MVIDTQLVINNNIQHDIPKDMSIVVHDARKEVREEIEKIFSKYLNNMTDEQIKNQVSQVVNYDYNYLGFNSEDIVSLMANFSMILAENTDDMEFLNSLKRSMKCIVDGDIKGHLQELKNDTNKSFLIVNMLLKGHAFSGIIYKRDDDNYKFVVVNKGYRLDYNKYEVYNISQDNIDYVINSCLMESNSSKKSIFTEDVYKILEDKGELISDEKVNEEVSDVVYSKLKSRDQKTGNCFYKNTESAFLLAWHTSFNKDEKLMTPKGPLSTKELHIKFMENVKKEKKDKLQKELLDYVDKEIDVYRRNKEFREYCKMNPNATADDKRRFSVRVFLDEVRVNELSDVEIEEKIDSVLAIADLQTLVDNREIFLVSNHVELINAVCKIADMLKYIDFLDTEEFIEMKDNFKKIQDRLQKNFPNVSEQLRKKIALCIQAGNKANKKEFRKIFDAVMELNKDDIAYYLRGEDFEEYSLEKEERLKEICEVVPNHNAARWEYIWVLIDGNKQKKALDECEAMILKDNKIDISICILVDILTSINEREGLDEIIERYNDYIVKNKQKAMAHYGLGVSYWLLGERDRAIENLDKACELDFRYAEFYLRFLLDRDEINEVIAKSDEFLAKDDCRSVKVLKAKAIIKKIKMDDDKDVDIKNLKYAKNIFTDEINLRYNNEEEYYLRGLCNRALGLWNEAKDDFCKVNNVEESTVACAMAYVYEVDMSLGLKRCGDYLTQHKDSEVIAWVEELMFADLEEAMTSGKMNKDRVRQIFEDAISEDNVDHFSQIKEKGIGNIVLCKKVLEEVVVKRLCERENISIKSSSSVFGRYMGGIVDGIKSLWQRTIGSIKR